MMQTGNFPILTNQSMGATFSSNPIMLTREWCISIQAVWTGSPVGNFTVEVSDDDGSDQFGTGVTNWDTYAGSTSAAGGAAGILTYAISDVSFKWARLKYTRASGTGTVNARANIKGVQYEEVFDASGFT